MYTVKGNIQKNTKIFHIKNQAVLTMKVVLLLGDLGRSAINDLDMSNLVRWLI
jgi:hypothetical protein